MFKTLGTITFFSLFFLSFSLGATASLGGFISASNAKEIEQRRSIGSGSRSTCHQPFSENSLTLLVPNQNVVHRSLSAKPSMYLRSTETSETPLKFSLVDPTVTKPIVSKTFTITQPGIKKLELPPQTQLKQGKTYLWYVLVPCTQENEGDQGIMTSAVEFVPDKNLQSKINKTKDENGKANIYAANGYWYEALESVIMEGDQKALERLLMSVDLKI